MSGISAFLYKKIHERDLAVHSVRIQREKNQSGKVLSPDSGSSCDSILDFPASKTLKT